MGGARRTTHSRTSPIDPPTDLQPLSPPLPCSSLAYRFRGSLGWDASVFRMNRNPERVVEKGKHIACIPVYRGVRFVRNIRKREWKVCHGSGQSTRSAAVASYLVSSGRPPALIKGLARCNRKGRLAFARFLDKLDSRISG